MQGRCPYVIDSLPGYYANLCPDAMQTPARIAGEYPFTAYYDKITPGCAVFLCDLVHHFCA